MSSNDLTEIFRALTFAATKHRKQKRKGPKESPYVNHPIDVAHRLVTVGGLTDTRTIVAAILHDTVEDTDTTLAELTSEFGEEVSALVAELTDDKSLPKEKRKEDQILNAPKKSVAAKAIKLADKTSNVREIREDPPTDWDKERRLKYFGWAEEVVAGLRGPHPALEAAFDKEVALSRRAES